jgi:hypothetical protein
MNQMAASKVTVPSLVYHLWTSFLVIVSILNLGKFLQFLQHKRTCIISNTARSRMCQLLTVRSQHQPNLPACSLFVWLISHQPAVLFSQNKPATSNQPAVLFSQNKPATSNQPAVLFSQNKSAPAISHQPNEQADGVFKRRAALVTFVVITASSSLGMDSLAGGGCQ